MLLRVSVLIVAIFSGGPLFNQLQLFAVLVRTPDFKHCALYFLSGRNICLTDLKFREIILHHHFLDVSVIFHLKLNRIGFDIAILCRSERFYKGVFLFYLQNALQFMRDCIAIFIRLCYPRVNHVSIRIPDLQLGSDHVLTSHNILFIEGQLCGVIIHGHMDILKRIPHLVILEIRILRPLCYLFIRIEIDRKGFPAKLQIHGVKIHVCKVLFF